jgi:hypothetical protein
MNGASIADLIRSGIPENLHNDLSELPDNVVLMSNWIEDVVEEPIEFGVVVNIKNYDRNLVVVADLNKKCSPNYQKVLTFPELYLEPMPIGYMFSPFMVPPKRRAKIERLLKEEIIKTEVGITKGGICGISIKDPDIHRRSMTHRAAYQQCNWGEFDKIANIINNQNRLADDET